MVLNAIERMESHASPKEPGPGARGRNVPSMSATNITASSSSPPLIDPDRETTSTGCAPFKQLGSREGKDVGFSPLGTMKSKALDSRRGAGRRSGTINSSFDEYSSSSADGIVISFGCLDEIVTGVCNVIPPVSDGAAEAPAASTASATHASSSEASKTGSCNIAGDVSVRGFSVGADGKEEGERGGIVQEQGQADDELGGSGTALTGGDGGEVCPRGCGTSTVRDEAGFVAEPAKHRDEGSNGGVSAADVATTSAKGAASEITNACDGVVIKPGTKDAPRVRATATSTVVDATTDVETVTKVPTSPARNSRKHEPLVSSVAGYVSDGANGNTGKVTAVRVNETSEQEVSSQARSAFNSSVASDAPRLVNPSVAQVRPTAPRRLNPRAIPFTFKPPSASRPCATSDMEREPSKTAKNNVSTVKSPSVAAAPDAAVPAADVAAKKGTPNVNHVDVVQATRNTPRVELTVPAGPLPPQPPPVSVAEPFAPAGALSTCSHTDGGVVELEAGRQGITDDGTGPAGGDGDRAEDGAASGASSRGGGALVVVGSEGIDSGEISAPVGLPVSVLCEIVLFTLLYC